jgi:hypothetical protein
MLPCQFLRALAPQRRSVEDVVTVLKVLGGMIVYKDEERPGCVFFFCFFFFTR